MRRLALVSTSLALALLLGCGGSKKPSPPQLSAPFDLAQLVGPELTTDAPLDTDVRQVAVAAGTTGYLVVWSQLGATGDDLYGARVSFSGEILDPGGFVISAAAGSEQSPAVDFDGTNWLVVWQDHRVGQFLNIYGARVSEAGTVLDPGGFAIDTQVDHQATPVVAFDGTNHVVAWADHRGLASWDVYAARVTPDGRVLEGDGFVVSAASFHQLAPAIASDGTTVLVVWQDQRSGSADVYGARITEAGVLDPTGIAISTAPYAQTSPAVAFDGARFVVAWQDGRSGADADLYAARVTPAGEVLDPSGIAVATGAGDQKLPAISFDGRYVVATWASVGATGTEVLGARLDTGGTLLDAPGFPVASAAAGASLALASDRDGRLLALYDPRDGAGAPRLDGRVVTTWATLKVVRAGRGGGAVASEPDGISCGGGCTAPFDAGTEVTLTAAPDGDSVFGGWSGACSGTGACTVRMDQDLEVTANFLPLYPVTVTLAGAPGTVSSSPAGIACGDACSARYVEGTTVQLAPQGARGASVFGAWDGACVGSGDCAVVVDGPKTVTATFVPAVTVTLAPSGSSPGTLSLGAVTCPTGSTCPVDVARGSDVTITAAPDATSVLKTFTGCTSWSEASCAVAAIPSSRYVGGRFEPRHLTLTGSPNGSGTGTITGSGLDCTTGGSAGCTALIDNLPFTTAYPSISLRATPSAGSVFKSWGACTAVSGDPAACTATMSGARTVYAKFEPSGLVLTASTLGNGAGTVSGAGLSCTTGGSAGCSTIVENPANSSAYTTLTLRATPAPASVFKSWGGCSAVSTDPSACTLVVSAARAVTAKFETSTIPLTATPTGPGAGTITGAGLSCTTGSAEGCIAAVENPNNTTGYTTVTLRAAPSSGSVFKSWSGCSAVSGDPWACTTLVSGARTVSARFETATVPLTVSTMGTGVGTISGAGLACTSGSTEGCTTQVANPDGSTAYTTVTLRAAPADGSVFKSWSGCTPLSDDPMACTISANGTKTATARFEPSTIPLSAAFGGAGAGTITGAGLACTTGSAEGCTAPVPNPNGTTAYTTVTLRATPLDGSVFKSWSGCTAVAGDPTACTVVVSSARTVTAKFEPSTIPLTAAFQGAGSGTITGAGLDCTTGSADGCTAPVENPNGTTAYTTVTLRATPLDGSSFKSWSGCTAVSGDPTACTVTVSAARTIYARFEPSTIALTASPIGAGSGTITGGGLACTTGSSDGCTVAVENPSGTTAYTTVTLRATALDGSVFKSWIGCSPVADDPFSCTVGVNAARTVSARFEPSTFPLTVSVTGAGTVSGPPGLACTAGAQDGCTAAIVNPAGTTSYTTVTLQATAADGSVFKSWTACSAVSGDPTTCTVVVNGAKAVTARFDPVPVL